MKKIIIAVSLLIYGVILIMQMAGGSDCTEEYDNHIKKMCSKKENITLWEQTFGTGKSDEIKKVKYKSVNLKDFFFKEETAIHYMEEAGKIYYVTLTILRDSDCQGSSGDFSITPLITPRCWFGDNIRGYKIDLNLVSDDPDNFRLYPENARYYRYVHDKNNVYVSGSYKLEDADPATFRPVSPEGTKPAGLQENLFTDSGHLYLDYRKIADESWDDLENIPVTAVTSDWDTMMKGSLPAENKAGVPDKRITLKKGRLSGRVYVFRKDDYGISSDYVIDNTDNLQCYFNNILMCNIGGTFFKINYFYSYPLFDKITESNSLRISREWDNRPVSF